MLLETLTLHCSNADDIGIDGIKNKIHPGDAMDKDLYELPESELKGIPTVSANLREALGALDKDRDFLKEGNVFSDNLIDAYISLKWMRFFNLNILHILLNLKCTIQFNYLTYFV